MQKVLQKLGILNLSNFEWYYTTDNKIFNDLYNLMAEKKLISNNTEKTSFSSITKQPIEGYIQNNNVFNLAINIVNLLQQAYLLKYDRILILEDDLVPLANNQLLNLYLNNYPENFDIVSMEYWFRNENDFFSVIDSNRKINEYFYLVSNERIVNFSCVGLSRNGIKHILDGMNQKFVASDMYIANQHMYDDWQINIPYKSIKTIGVTNDLELGYQKLHLNK